MKPILFLLPFLLILNSCGNGAKVVAPGSADAAAVVNTFREIKANILDVKCSYCHSGSRASSDVSFDDYEATLSNAGTVVPYSPQTSQLFVKTYNGTMPPRHMTPLTSSELQSLYNWIALGAQNN